MPKKLDSLTPRLPPPPDSPPGLAKVVDRSLAIKPAGRSSTAAWFGDGVSELHRGSSLPSRSSSTSTGKAADRLVYALRSDAAGGRLLHLIENSEAAIRDGLPFAALDAAISRFKLHRDEVAALLHLSPRTFMRRKIEQRLHPEESDRLLRIVRVIALASEVLESEQHALAWLRASNRALGGRIPLALMDIDLGVHQVEQLLGRIEHGVYS